MLINYTFCGNTSILLTEFLMQNVCFTPLEREIPEIVNVKL